MTPSEIIESWERDAKDDQKNSLNIIPKTRAYKTHDYVMRANEKILTLIASHKVMTEALKEQECGCADYTNVHTLKPAKHTCGRCEALKKSAELIGGRDGDA